MGMLLGVLILPANFSDDYGAKAHLQQIAFVSRWLLFIFDGGYDKPPLIDWCQKLFGVTVLISRRIAEHGFQVSPKTLDCRTHFWLAQSLAPFKQRLRRTLGCERKHDLHRYDPSHAPTPSSLDDDLLLIQNML